MEKNMNLNGMSYNELVAKNEETQRAISKLEAKSAEYQKAISLKREEAIKDALRVCMDTYGVTKEEMIFILKGNVSIERIELDVAPETLPEHKEENESVVPSSAPEKTPVDGIEKTLPTMESLFIDDPEYKAFYHPVTPEKKSNRRLPTLDELLSGEPVNRILCMGNEEPKGKSFRQNTRFNHVGGIIPTETASGKTGIYIPVS